MENLRISASVVAPMLLMMLVGYISRRAGIVTEDTMRKVAALKEIADARGEKLHQLALQWVLRDEVVTSALIGASRPEQITDNAEILSMPPLSEEEIRKIDSILK